MSRYYDSSQSCVLYGDNLVPEDAFQMEDQLEAKLVTLVFQLTHRICMLKLNEVELALFSAIILLSAGI